MNFARSMALTRAFMASLLQIGMVLPVFTMSCRVFLLLWINLYISHLFSFVTPERPRRSKKFGETISIWVRILLFPRVEVR